MEVYFDCAASSPLLPSVKTRLTESFDTYGNPSSLHRIGMTAERKLDEARKEVMRTLGVANGQFVFTGSGTEANNLAVFGTAKKLGHRGRHAVTTQIEHKCVLETYRALERDGWNVTYVAPESDGSISAQKILDAVTEDTVIVSAMHVNNETGAILPLQTISKELKTKSRAVLHVDGVQAFGKLKDSAKLSGADLYSVSGHKIGAPKGIGGLYIRQGLHIDPIVYGGGQEFGLRSGTQNVMGAIAMGEAAKTAREQTQSYNHVTELSQTLIDGLSQMPDVHINRAPDTSPYVLSVTFKGLKGEVMLHAFESKGLYVSTGSACSTKSGISEGSYVLKAMGRDKSEVDGTIRFSFGWWHTIEDVRYALDVVEEQVSWLRKILM